MHAKDEFTCYNLLVVFHFLVICGNMSIECYTSSTISHQL